MGASLPYSFAATMSLLPVEFYFDIAAQSVSSHGRLLGLALLRILHYRERGEGEKRDKEEIERMR